MLCSFLSDLILGTVSSVLLEGNVTIISNKLCEDMLNFNTQKVLLISFRKIPKNVCYLEIFVSQIGLDSGKDKI